jgi:hypothetical protein
MQLVVAKFVGMGIPFEETHRKETVMEVLNQVLSWGSPLGIGLFMFLMTAGSGIFFWGLSHLNKNDRGKRGEKG